ncbi:hypothetical protein HK44_016225 [Pseudomonas fluorescens HK44]|uniref:Uncharacterized protein n=1 Tax=Pseudomonas fluorescens HK44 TaxID=1042209 RepID=A0A010RWM1_PSEFL|nr:hypothetical protein [Pseudomonas fluorescens]EXF96626.1 hypothetical protein HK44_016225 [Pseudomonas fluorescens HK44]
MFTVLPKATLALTAVIASSFLTTAESASFDCNKASNAVEFAICGNGQLSSLDDSLSLEYRQALSRNPNIKKFQLDWLTGPRDSCGAQVACLVSAYQQQLEMLRNINGKPAVQAQAATPVENPVASPVSTSAPADASHREAVASEPKLAADNPIPILFDAKVLYTSQSYLNEYAWSDPQSKLFGKPVTQWTDNDFAYLEFQLNKQISAERDEAAAWNAQHKLKANPEDDSTYRIRTGEMRKIIAGIPRFKYWIQQANIKLAAQQAQQQQQLLNERQAQVERDKAQVAARLEAQRQVTVRQEQDSTARIVFFVVAAIVAVLAIFIWNTFIRKRCSRCKSLNFVVDDVTELERFRGHVKVREKHSRGTNTRVVSAMLTINEYDYRCKDCGHQWSEKKKEELGANV